MVSTRLRQFAACAAVISLVGGLSLPMWASSHAVRDVDSACGPVAFSGHPTEQFENVRSPLGPSHCAVCHWWRALGGARASHSPVSLGWLEPGGFSNVMPAVWLGQPLVSDRPSRAPPIL